MPRGPRGGLTPKPGNRCREAGSRMGVCFFVARRGSGSLPIQVRPTTKVSPSGVRLVLRDPPGGRGGLPSQPPSGQVVRAR